MTVNVQKPAATSAREWAPLDPSRAKALVDARLQVHHAAQLATAAGISYLTPAPDDSHTSLEWLPTLGALASQRITAPAPFRIAVQPANLALWVLDDANERRGVLSLHGRTVADAADWIREHIAELGQDAARYTLARHYVIPDHPVHSGAPFDASDHAAFAELTRWFGNAATILQAVVSQTTGAGPVRCWPHHFDIATLVTIGADSSGRMRTIGAGVEPGDVYYAEPYVYVNMYPAPRNPALPSLAGGGGWHTHEWLGAVLRGSDVISDPARQPEQIGTFVRSAVNACRQLLV